MNSTALRVMWLPVLTTVPQMEDLGAYRGHLSSLLPGLRAERGLDTADLAPQTRALCSHCSCESDHGCLYNCDRCGALCLSCDCASSLSCQYNCDKCEDIQVGSTTTPPLISPVVVEGDGAEHFLETVHNQFQPDTDQAGIAPPGNWPQISPVVAEADGAEHFLGTVHNQFRPDTDQEEVVPPGNWPQLAPVLAEEEDSDTFSWLDLDPKASSCVPKAGPARGRVCRFPFKYQGTLHYDCAPLEGKMKSLTASAAVKGWCSTKRDINGIHIRGPYADPWRNIGLCYESCQKK